MADSGIKKAIILNNNLPPVNSSNGYLVRYRIISEDRNRVSHWSPISEVIADLPSPVNGAVTYADGVVSIVWDDVLNHPEYDVFVRFDQNSEGYRYHGTSSVHSYSLLNEGTTQIDVTVQIASSSKIPSPILEIYSETILI